MANGTHLSIQPTQRLGTAPGNSAWVGELKLSFERIGPDVLGVIEAAATMPVGFTWATGWSWSPRRLVWDTRNATRLGATGWDEV